MPEYASPDDCTEAKRYAELAGAFFDQCIRDGHSEKVAAQLAIGYIAALRHEEQSVDGDERSPLG